MQFNQDFIKFLSAYGIVTSEDDEYHFEPEKISKHVSQDLLLCPLLDWSWLKVSGEDSAKFLQGQLTCDVNTLTAHHGSLGAHCTRKGTVIATFYIYLRDSAYYLHLPRMSAPLLQKKLRAYAKFSKVSIELAPNDLISIGVAGKHSHKSLHQHIGSEASLIHQQYLHQDVYVHHIPGEVDRFVCSARIGAIQSLWQNLINNGVTLCDDTLWHWHDIQHRLAHIYPQTSELFTPHALALPEHHGVSFTKGCYTGQEIVARMHYLGAGKRKLSYCQRPMGLPYKPGDTLLDEDEKPLGIVVMHYSDIAKNIQHLLAVLG